MKHFTHAGDILSIICRSENKWGMYVSFWHENLDEVCKAAPYLDDLEFLQCRVNGSGYLLFDTQEELMERYHQTVGDDGPTHLNSYNGPARVYALTCDPAGDLMTENT